MPPETIAAFADAELVGHGRTNLERQGELSEYEERLLIEETTARDRKAFGQTPARLAWTLDFTISSYP